MQPMHASFDEQEQAEEAIRKLASLRADRFRMERAVHGCDFGSANAAPAAPMNELANRLVNANAAAAVEAGAELGSLPSAPFSLSVQVPAEAMEQAKSVIAQAGGRLI